MNKHGPQATPDGWEVDAQKARFINDYFQVAGKGVANSPINFNSQVPQSSMIPAGDPVSVGMNRYGTPYQYASRVVPANAELQLVKPTDTARLIAAQQTPDAQVAASWQSWIESPGNPGLRATEGSYPQGPTAAPSTPLGTDTSRVGGWPRNTPPPKP